MGNKQFSITNSEHVGWIREWTFDGESKGSQLYDISEEVDCARDVKDDGGVCKKLYTSSETHNIVRSESVANVGMRDGIYKDSTPKLNVGDSAFEDWFQAAPFACQVGIKQISRDSYAAGMGDPLVTYASPKAITQIIDDDVMDDNAIERAAQTLAECMDYPWTTMPEQGRKEMRTNALAIIASGIKHLQLLLTLQPINIGDISDDMCVEYREKFDFTRTTQHNIMEAVNAWINHRA